jgi:tRNA dimethylallyltransferase
MKENICIVITGPTAVGKTACAVRWAQHFSTSIISADSRQCYRELDIGVAKPDPIELAAVPHYFINSHSIHEEVNASVFERYALEVANKLFRQHNLVIMVGGTGLYIKAFTSGLDEMPPIDTAVRASLRQEWDEKGLYWLQETVRNEDPVYYSAGEIQNPQRLLRALEVLRSTGRSIRSFQRGEPVQRPFKIVQLGLELPRNLLYERINQRVDEMVKKGLEEELERLKPFISLNALQTVGYREWIPYFEGRISREEVIEEIKKNTRHYAKRQLTWLKRDESITWVDARDEEAIVRFMSHFEV